MVEQELIWSRLSTRTGIGEQQMGVDSRLGQVGRVGLVRIRWEQTQNRAGRQNRSSQEQIQEQGRMVERSGYEQTQYQDRNWQNSRCEQTQDQGRLVEQKQLDVYGSRFRTKTGWQNRSSQDQMGVESRLGQVGRIGVVWIRWELTQEQDRQVEQQ